MCAAPEDAVEYELHGKTIKLSSVTVPPAYEPTLITAPADPRIVHLMATLQRYQRVTAGQQETLAIDAWKGRWTKGSLNADWPLFLAFLGVPPEAFEEATTYQDNHWYIMREDSFTMRHYIPSQSLDLRYTARIDGEWRPSPYNEETSASYSRDEKKKHRFNWRHRWIKYPVYMRTEWENLDAGGRVTSYVSMNRHLIAPDIINFRVWVYPEGEDPEDESKFLVPALGGTYVRVGDELPPVVPQEH